MTTLKDMLMDLVKKAQENAVADYEDQVDPEVLVDETLNQVKDRLIGS